MSIIRFQRPKKNIWTRRRQGKFEKTLRAYSGIIAIMVMAVGFMLHQNGYLRSALNETSYRRPFNHARPIVTRPSWPRVLFGRASVVDGDTIRIKGERIRLHGIDAPEFSQICIGKKNTPIRCGQQSTRYLKHLIQAKPQVSCRFVSRDAYGRFVGDCFFRSGQSLSDMMVRNGHALDWPKYSRGAHAQAQHLAKSERLGIWSTRFEMPWNYRAKRRG